VRGLIELRETTASVLNPPPPLLGSGVLQSDSPHLRSPAAGLCLTAEADKTLLLLLPVTAARRDMDPVGLATLRLLPKCALGTPAVAVAEEAAWPAPAAATPAVAWPVPTACVAIAGAAALSIASCCSSAAIVAATVSGAMPAGSAVPGAGTAR
jgi:hypothetical protein